MVNHRTSVEHHIKFNHLINHYKSLQKTFIFGCRSWWPSTHPVLELHHEISWGQDIALRFLGSSLAREVLPRAFQPIPGTCGMLCWLLGGMVSWEILAWYPDVRCPPKTSLWELKAPKVRDCYGWPDQNKSPAPRWVHQRWKKTSQATSIVGE